MDARLLTRKTLLLFLLLLTLAGAGAWWHRELIFGPDLDRIGGSHRQRILLSSVSPRSVHSLWKPVFLFHNGEFFGCGTLVSHEGQNPFVVATRHQFPDGTEGCWSYQVIRPFDPARHPISHVAPLDEERDLVICRPGESKVLVGLDTDYYDPRLRKSVYPLNTGPLRSLMSGREHLGVEYAQDEMSPGSDVVRALGRRTVGPGESGSGYVTGEGALFVVSRGGDLTPDEVGQMGEFSLTPPPSADQVTTGYRIRRGELEAVDVESPAWIRRADHYQEHARAQLELARTVPPIDLPGDIEGLRSDPRLRAVPPLLERLNGLEAAALSRFGVEPRRGQDCSRAMARFAMIRGDWRQADRICQELLDHNPFNNAAAHVEYGLNLIAQGFTRVGGVQLGFARTIHEERYAGHKSLALLDAWREAAALSANGEHDAAREARDRADAMIARARDAGPAGLTELANGFMDMRREKWARKFYAEALAESPEARKPPDADGGMDDLLREVAGVLKGDGHADLAAGVIHRLTRHNVRRSGTSEEDRIESLNRFLRTEPPTGVSMEVARACAGLADRLTPDAGRTDVFLDSLERVAARLAETDHHGGAERLWHRVLELTDEFPADRGDAAGDAGENKEMRSRRTRAVVALADVLTDAGRPQDALDEISARIGEDFRAADLALPAAPDLLLARARAHRAVGERAAAETDLRQAILHIPADGGDHTAPARIHGLLALLREDERRVTDAMEEMRLAMSELRKTGLKSDSLPLIEARQKLSQLAEQGETVPPPLGVPDRVYAG